MVDELETTTFGMSIHALEEFKVDVVDTLTILKAVDQVERRTANTLDSRQSQLHWARGNINWLCAMLQRIGISMMGISHPESHATGARPMLFCEIGDVAIRFLVEDKIYIALAVQSHILGTVFRNCSETH